MPLSGAFLFLIGFIVIVSGSGLFESSEPVNQILQTPTPAMGLVQQSGYEPSATLLPHRPASAFSTPDSYVPIVTLPDFPIPSPVISVTPQPGEPEPDASAISRIVIPALMLDTVVKYVPFDGTTWMITGLRQEIAWMGDTSWPGLGGNTGLAGHVTVAGMGDGPFRHLEELPVGELVLLYTEHNIYTYQVRESFITDEGDMTVIAPTDDAQITLITCVDWDEDNHIYLNRLVVVADLIRTEPLAIGRLP
jgi:sortase A